MRSLWPWLLMLAACGGSAGGTSPDAASAVDAPPPIDAAPAIDAPAVTPPTPCPTTGSGALVATNASCVVFTPATTGAAAAGANATVDEYALAPTAGATGRLVLFLNPSLGSPAQSIADPATNIYTAATAAGDHVLAISYSSDDVVGVLCKGHDACFLPTRMTVMTGAYQPGAPASFASIGPTEGIYARTALALRYLAAAQPTAGWDQYLDPTVDAAAHPDAAVRWSKVFAMGHSQGGGHAALLAKLQPLARLVMLSSSCDAVGQTPVSWQTYDATWATSPAAIGFGFATLTTFDPSGAPTGGDTTCPAHAAVWSALGVASARRFEDAAQCAGASAHTATTKCTANMARVQSLLTP